MVKCPFCQFENEDGALFCEQCKSDLGSAQPAVPAAATPEHPADVPVAAAVEDAPAIAEPVLMEGTPVAEESIPMAAPVAEAVPERESARTTEEYAPLASASVSPESPPVAEAAAPTPEGEALPEDAKPRLVVMRGLKIGVEYPLYEGLNFVGRSDEKPVDIDLEDQEPPDRIWSSRQHALISSEGGRLSIEDLNSSNGTFVNRQRIYPGQKRPLNVNDVIQIGTVQMKVKA